MERSDPAGTIVTASLSSHDRHKTNHLPYSPYHRSRRSGPLPNVFAFSFQLHEGGWFLPPLTRFYMVILPTVGFVRAFGALFTHV